MTHCTRSSAHPLVRKQSWRPPAPKLIALNPELTIAQVRDLPISTATDAPGGFKQLNTKAALEKLKQGFSSR
jgi:hypothetical protein